MRHNNKLNFHHKLLKASFILLWLLFGYQRSRFSVTYCCFLLLSKLHENVNEKAKAEEGGGDFLAKTKYLCNILNQLCCLVFDLLGIHLRSGNGRDSQCLDLILREEEDDNKGCLLIL